MPYKLFLDGTAYTQQDTQVRIPFSAVEDYLANQSVVFDGYPQTAILGLDDQYIQMSLPIRMQSIPCLLFYSFVSSVSASLHFTFSLTSPSPPHMTQLAGRVSDMTPCIRPLTR